MKDNLESAAKLEASAVSVFFTQRWQNLQITADVPLVHSFISESNMALPSAQYADMQDWVTSLFETRVENLSYLKHISAVNVAGTVISSTDTEIINTQSRFLDRKIIQQRPANSNSLQIYSAPLIIVFPVYEKDDYRGFIEMCIEESYFNHLIDKVPVPDKGYFVIFDGSNTPILPTRPYITAFLSNEEKLKSDWAVIKNNGGGFIDYKLSGIHHIGFYTQIENTDWGILAGIHASELTDPVA